MSISEEEYTMPVLHCYRCGHKALGPKRSVNVLCPINANPRSYVLCEKCTLHVMGVLEGRDRE